MTRVGAESTGRGGVARRGGPVTVALLLGLLACGCGSPSTPTGPDADIHDGGDGDADGDADADGDGDADAPSDGGSDAESDGEGGLDSDVDAEADVEADEDEAPPEPIFEPNPTAREDGFALFYRERAERVLLSVNRFALGGDSAMGSFFGKSAVARSGEEYEVVLGPNDNNPFGTSLFATWSLYQALGGRGFELTLIRMLEGVSFNEAVSGHPGLTTREALPGWTREMDGVSRTVSRSRMGAAITAPVVYDPGLEAEILETFYDGVVFTYRENPEELWFSFMPIAELESFAVTFVFDALDEDPAFLRISDCCSSFMRSGRGPWAGAYWGNHNSRDNFTDLTMGFLTALEMEATAGLPVDVAAAATRAADATRRTGDIIVAHGNVLMTVDEWHDYDTLTAAGAMNPDGEVEWQDLGSLASCQMAYLAHAISSEGLTVPVPETPLPGDIGLSALRDLLSSLGISSPSASGSCTSLDDAFDGLTWRQILDAEVFGMSIWDYIRVAALADPDLIPSLIGSALDDFAELLMGPMALCYYARIVDDEPLFAEAAADLDNLLAVQALIADLAFDRGDPAQAARADEMLYMGAVYARMFGLDSPLSRIAGFDRGESHTAYLEEQLSMDDTAPWPMLTDEEILAAVEARLVVVNARAPWRVERYRDRFGSTPPVRRAGAGYEAVRADDSWGPVDNARHRYLHLGHIDLWFEATLCIDSPQTLDCRWARRGCEPADLDDSGGVDGADQARFDELRATFGDGATCNAGNRQCDGADLDGDGTLDDDDRAFMSAAQGCTL